MFLYDTHCSSDPAGIREALETVIAGKPDEVLSRFQGHQCTPCPETWLQHGENCYRFSKEWRTWQESKAQCFALESRLLKMDSKEELVKMIFFSLSLITHSAFYCGLKSHRTLSPVFCAVAPCHGPRAKNWPCPFGLGLLFPWCVFTDFRGVNWETPTWVHV